MTRPLRFVGAVAAIAAIHALWALDEAQLRARRLRRAIGSWP